MIKSFSVLKRYVPILSEKVLLTPKYLDAPIAPAVPAVPSNLVSDSYFALEQ